MMYFPSWKAVFCKDISGVTTGFGRVDAAWLPEGLSFREFAAPAPMYVAG
jgi:hypothetical protein